MSHAVIVEVSPRDGLQNDPAELSTQDKVELVRRCAQAGIRRIEAASFVNPQRVPQMADAEQVLEGIDRELAGVREQLGVIGLVLNTRGYERARLTSVDVLIVDLQTLQPYRRSSTAVAGRPVTRATTAA